MPRAMLIRRRFSAATIFIDIRRYASRCRYVIFAMPRACQLCDAAMLLFRAADMRPLLSARA